VNPTKPLSRPSRPVPSKFQRLYAVFMRHVVVYFNDFLTNAFPTVVEPLIFIVAVGWGLARRWGRSAGSITSPSSPRPRS